MNSKFKRKEISTTKEILEIIKKGESYVRSFLASSKDGIYSTELQGASRHNLYVGTAGILHMYIALYNVTKCKTYEKYIIGITSFLKKHVFDGIETAQKEGELVPGMAAAFYSGIGGIGLVLNEVAHLFHNQEAKEGALLIADYYKNNYKKVAEGIYWSGNSPIFFDGGILLFLIDTYKIYKDIYNEKQLTLMQMIKKGTDYILAHGITHENGGLEIDYHHVDFKHKEPNFEFGTAGNGYLFTKVYEITGDEKYLDAAMRTVLYLKSIAVKQKKGYLIPYKLGKYDNLFYLGNCHGPVGTAKLFYELYKVTNNQAYFKEVTELAAGAHSLGAPFSQSPGFWNTTCVCCGPAGYMPFYIGIYKVTKEEIWKKYAHEVGEILAGSITKDHWEIAFDRTKPEVITSPAGYFTGTAGIVVALLQLYALEEDKSGIVGLIDDPYCTS